jgi:hypothetical protein
MHRRTVLRVVGASSLAAAFLLGPRTPSLAQTVSWTRQFGTPGYEWVGDVGLTGGVAVAAGHSHERLRGCDSAGELFVRAVSAADGSLLWCREFGASDDLMNIGGVAADATGVYVGGSLWGRFRGQRRVGRQDAFVRKYDLAGNVVWTRQFGTHRLDATTDVALGGGGLYVLGMTNGPLGGSTVGLDDVFVRRYDVTGEVDWTARFGTAASDAAFALAADAGGASVGGHTEGTFPWQSSPTSGSEGFIVQLRPDGVERWHRRIDAPGDDAVNGLAIDESGALTAVGSSPGIDGERLFGSDAMFVRRYGQGGAVWWTRTFGSSAFGDRASGVAADASGIYVVGSTYGHLPGASNRGRTDAFAMSLNDAGSLAWVDQFGSREKDELFGVAVDAGDLVVGGDSWGRLHVRNHGVEDAVLRGYVVTSPA